MDEQLQNDPIQQEQHEQQQQQHQFQYQEVRDQQEINQVSYWERRNEYINQQDRGYIATNMSHSYKAEGVQVTKFKHDTFEKALSGYVTKHVNKAYLQNYKDIFKLKSRYNNSNVKKDRYKKVNLYASRGTAYAANGEDTLQFDIGGSGAHDFCREASFKNSKKVRKLSNGSIPMDRVRTSNYKILRFLSKISRFKWFNWIPRLHDPNDPHIREYNETADYNRDVVLGKQVTLQTRDGKRKKYEFIRKKDTMDEFGIQKTRYNLGGPQGFFSLANTGDYSMENLEDYVLSLGSQWLAPKLDDMMKRPREDWKNIHVMMQGHSRGGTATSMAAMRLNHWIHENYPEEIAMLVKFDIVLHDPVPGKFSRTGIREKVNFDTKSKYDKDGKVIPQNSGENGKYRSLEGQQESTVFYSLRVSQEHFFTPQQVNGAKRIIITPFGHLEAGYPRMEDEMAKNATKEQHRKAYIDPLTMSAFRGHGINSLPEGVYFSDENGTLVKIESWDGYLNVLDRIYHKLPLLANSDSQEKRFAVIGRAVREFFDRKDQGKVDQHE